MKTAEEITALVGVLTKEYEVLFRQAKAYPAHAPEVTRLLMERNDVDARLRALQWVLRPSAAPDHA